MKTCIENWNLLIIICNEICWRSSTSCLYSFISDTGISTRLQVLYYFVWKIHVCSCALSVESGLFQLPVSSEGKEWFWYVDKDITLLLLEGKLHTRESDNTGLTIWLWVRLILLDSKPDIEYFSIPYKILSIIHLTFMKLFVEFMLNTKCTMLNSEYQILFTSMLTTWYQILFNQVNWWYSVFGYEQIVG